jgi:hypothetical protein
MSVLAKIVVILKNYHRYTSIQPTYLGEYTHEESIVEKKDNSIYTSLR